jgi:hypothetical protein
MHRVPFLRITRLFLAILLCVSNCNFILAYEVPLSPQALHEAYILGQRNDQATAAFLAPYVNQVAEDTATQHIAGIEILTPFAQVVDRSRGFTSDYSEEQAAREYHQRGDTVIVRIVLMLPAAYPKPPSADGSTSAPPSKPPASNSALQPENFWQNFRFDVKQHGKPLKSRSIRNKPIYSTPTKDTPAVLDGATVWLEYDAKDVTSDETLIEVTTPQSKTIDTTFDLKKLR